MNQSQAVEAHLRHLRIVCGALSSSVVMFGCLVWYLVSTGSFSPTMDGSIPLLGTVLNLVGLSLLVPAHFFPVLMKAPGRDATEEDVLAWHMSSTVVAFAIREGAAFMALVGALLTGSLAPGFAVAGVALLAMLLAWPKESQLEHRD